MCLWVYLFELVRSSLTCVSDGGLNFKCDRSVRSCQARKWRHTHTYTTQCLCTHRQINYLLKHMLAACTYTNYTSVKCFRCLALDWILALSETKCENSHTTSDGERRCMQCTERRPINGAVHQQRIPLENWKKKKTEIIPVANYNRSAWQISMN